jgi:hypothetical protein
MLGMTFNRDEPPLIADERTLLTGFLDYQRQTLGWKCDGLTDEQLREHGVSTSNLTLLGLVRHMAGVENWWFQVVIGGEPDEPILAGQPDDGRDFDFNEIGGADVARDFATWKAQCDASRTTTAEHDLDATGRHLSTNEEFSLRWVLIHMIEEYARHNGHADLIREAIDGAVGE